MKIILVGAAGNMGREVADMAFKRGDQILFGVDKRIENLPFPVYSSLQEAEKKEGADSFRGAVCIDFSSPEGVKERAEFCAGKKLPLLFAATGLSPEQEEALSCASKKIPVLLAPNLSFTMAVFMRLAGIAAKLLKDFDAEIVEVHRLKKRDAPSGTSKELKATIEREREGGNIPIHSLRLGDIAGEHAVIFAHGRETFTLSHSAGDRSVFARGALLAAESLIQSPAGFFTVDDIFSPIFSMLCLT